MCRSLYWVHINQQIKSDLFYLHHTFLIQKLTKSSIHVQICWHHWYKIVCLFFVILTWWISTGTKRRNIYIYIYIYIHTHTHIHIHIHIYYHLLFLLSHTYLWGYNRIWAWFRHWVYKSFSYKSWQMPYKILSWSFCSLGIKWYSVNIISPLKKTNQRKHLCFYDIGYYCGLWSSLHKN